MPRKRKAARAFRRPGELSDCQRLTLWHGDPILPFPESEGFADETAERAAWCAHRADLLAEFVSDSPCRRPWAFWRFDIGREDALRLEWWQEYELLESMNLLSADEKLMWEKSRFPQLHISDAESQAAAVVSATLAHCSGHLLNEIIGEREFRARWHAARGEDNLAKFHGLIAAGLQ